MKVIWSVGGDLPADFQHLNLGLFRPELFQVLLCQLGVGLTEDHSDFLGWLSTDLLCLGGTFERSIKSFSG